MNINLQRKIGGTIVDIKRYKKLYETISEDSDRSALFKGLAFEVLREAESSDYISYEDIKTVVRGLLSNETLWESINEAIRDGIEEIQIVTEDEFIAYERVRLSGDYNMFDPRARAETGLCERTYLYILGNYDKCYNKYEQSVDKLRGE